MKYTQVKFTLPVSSGRVTQEQWERAVGVPQKGAKELPSKAVERRRRLICGKCAANPFGNCDEHS